LLDGWPCRATYWAAKMGGVLAFLIRARLLGNLQRQIEFLT